MKGGSLRRRKRVCGIQGFDSVVRIGRYTFAFVPVWVGDWD
jgi:hypothetical protein